ncbi:MAG: isocitrate dehydrogenase (NAD+) [Myxococcota bacterium]|jgi:isocitrate dehydrogenase (NAD+)
MHSITLVPGDSAANITAVRRILEASCTELSFDVQDWTDGEPPEALLTSAKKNKTVLLGHKKSAADDKPAPIVQLRRALGVFANLRPIKGIAGIKARFPNANVLVVRETTEDVYAQLEHESLKGVFESLKVTTKAGCERIAHHAFQTARRLGRKRVTIVHKANIMKMSDGLFLRTALAIAEEYPDILCDECIVDALCMKLVRNPADFDVLLCGNLFGDIVSDLCAGLVGGAVNSPSLNEGPEGLRIYTSGHGEPAGDSCCPTSLAFSAVLMLRDLGETEAANKLMTGLTTALSSDSSPKLLGGTANASTFADAVIRSIEG